MLLFREQSRKIIGSFQVFERLKSNMYLNVSIQEPYFFSALWVTTLRKREDSPLLYSSLHWDQFQSSATSGDGWGLGDLKSKTFVRHHVKSCFMTIQYIYSKVQPFNGESFFCLISLIRCSCQRQGHSTILLGKGQKLLTAAQWLHETKDNSLLKLVFYPPNLAMQLLTQSAFKNVYILYWGNALKICVKVHASLTKLPTL